MNKTMALDRRKVKGNILNRANYDYARHNELRVTPYEYQSTPQASAPLVQQAQIASLNQQEPDDTILQDGQQGGDNSSWIVQHGNSPSTQNTLWNGQRIRSLRKRMRLSARKFGHVLGFPGKNCHVTIYRHESDKIKPSKQTVMILEQLEKNVSASVT